MSLKKQAGPDDLMTAADAARILEISSDMVRLLARGGGLPFLATVRGVRLFRRADVDALARARAKQRSRQEQKRRQKLTRAR
jgi:excisionase family DNA binding protein